MKLKPCPFCGSKRPRSSMSATWEGVFYTNKYFVMCLKCAINGPICDTEKEAKEKWNKRGKCDL